MNEEDVIYGIYNWHQDRSAARFSVIENELLSKLASPIEKILAAAFWASMNGDVTPIHLVKGLFLCDIFPCPAKWPVVPIQRPGVTVFPQSEVGRYIADFLMIVQGFNNSPPSFVVIECDGHEFHERTKDQARHDRRRDRWMTTNGISVLRFTGSEIWADPLKCADEVFSQATNLIYKTARAA